MVAAVSQVGSVVQQSAKPQAALGEASFAKALSAAEGAGKTETSVREAAKSLVSMSFVLPLLKQARQDPFKSDLLHGGSAEETWGSQLDATIADRITAKSNFPMVDAVYRSIMANANRTQRPVANKSGSNSTGSDSKLKVSVNG